MNLLDLKKTVKNALKKNIWTIQMNCAEIIFVHENRTKNIGDLMSCPFHFFPKMRQKSIVANIWRFKEKFSLKNKLIIVGGGGLLQPYYSEPVENILKLSTYNRVIFWGVGLDNHISERITYPNDRKEAVFGVRDFFSYSDIYKKLNCQYVPCASCMSSLFDKYADTPTRFPVKLYLHKHYMPPPQFHITNFTSYDR